MLLCIAPKLFKTNLFCFHLQQERIEETKLDLKVTKEKIALLLWEYQDLLNVKMALEIEITTYRCMKRNFGFKAGPVFPV